jgi:hypothetical protein
MWFFIFTPKYFSNLNWVLTALTTFTFHLFLGYLWKIEQCEM